LYRWAEQEYDRAPALAAELVRRAVTVLVATGNTELAAKSATATIPIVFVTGADPVESGAVASLNRPGGNLTGAYFLTGTLTAKRLELLHEIAPAATLIGSIANPAQMDRLTQLREAEAAARILGVRIVRLDASTPTEIEAVFAGLAEQRIGALLMGGDPFFIAQRVQLAALAARHAVPAVYAWREAVEDGGLMSYGTSATDGYRLIGTYTGHILKGTKPADLPVQQSTRIEMVLNLKTAKALGIEVPTSILLRATEVIE